MCIIDNLIVFFRSSQEQRDCFLEEKAFWPPYDNSSYLTFVSSILKLEKMQVSVIGAGTMGNGIAHVFIQNGFEVKLIDVSQPALDKAVATINGNFDRQIKKGSISEADKQTALSRLSLFTVLEDGVKSADLVVEAATENVALKTQDICRYGQICA